MANKSESRYDAVLRTLAELQDSARNANAAREQLMGGDDSLQVAEAAERNALASHQAAIKAYRAEWTRRGGR